LKPPISQKPKQGDAPHREGRAPEAGFALYLAIGFIVLISVLAGSVGTNLNLTAIKQARAIEQRATLDSAEMALAEAWYDLRTNFDRTLTPLYLVGHSEVFNAAVAADHTACVGAHESVLTGYKQFARAPLTGDSYRRFFIQRDGNLYRLYGCGFDGDSTRVAYGEYLDDGTSLSLVRARRY
jgi:hypothetical protein